jgi:hypothetical protein
MKKIAIFLTLITIGLSYDTVAQNRAGFHHIIRKSQFDSLTYRNTKTGETKRLALTSDKVGVVSLDKGIAIVDLWSITGNPGETSDATINNQTKLGDWRLEIDLTRKSLGEPTKLVKIPYEAWAFGIGTIPLRLRPPRNGLSAATSSQLTFVGNYNYVTGNSYITHRAINNYSISYGVFLGLATADIKKNTLKDANLYTTDRTNIAATGGVNVILSRNNLGLVISVGLDKGFGKQSGEWIYQMQPWLGLGIQTSLGFF